VQIAAAPGENVVTGLVAFLERLGEASYLYVRLAGGELVTVRESGQTSAAIGNPIHLYFPPNCMHLFDADDVAAKRSVDENPLDQPMLAGVSITRTAMTT
jgi:multiple sugar transport system ATP-binding protein